MILISCAPGLKASSDDEGGCMDGWERDQNYRCVPASDGEPSPGSECETSTDCTEDKCLDGSMACTCMESSGVCVPTCFEDADCPQVDETDLECNPEGLCVPIEDEI